MLKVKPFLLFIILTMFVTLFTTACSNTGDGSTGLGGGIYDNSTTNPGGDTGGDNTGDDNTGGSTGDKTGVTKVSEFPANPMALLGVYNVTSQVVNEISQQVAQGSEFRVNVDITRLSEGFVDVLVRINVNGTTIDFNREVALAGQTIGPEFFEEIFGSMGAEVTGDYTLKFTLTSETYSELVDAGIISEGQTLVLSLDKTKDLSAGEGLDDETTGGDSSEDNPDNPDNPTEVPVESVTISGQPESVVHGGASFSLSAAVLPTNAANQGVKWSSSQPAYISVDENTGFVRILGYTTNPVTITAYSVENNAVKDEWTFNIEKAAVTSIKVTPSSMELTLKKDDSAVSANITAAVEPAIASEYTEVSYKVTEGQDYIKVDERGVVTALQEGNATVTVTAGAFTETVTVIVKPAPIEEIPVENIAISTPSDKVYQKGTNVTINFTLTPLATTDTMVSFTTSTSISGNISTSNGEGSFEFLNVQNGDSVTFKAANGKEVTYIITAVDAITTVSFVNKQITVEQNQTKSNTLENANIIQSSSSTITYKSLTPDIASVNETTGEVTGKKNGLATIQVAVQPKYDSEPKYAEYTVDVLGYIDYADENSLQGTYDIVFFGTNSNGTTTWISGTAAILQTDCETYKSLWNSKSCSVSGTLGNYEIPDNDFAGRAVINVVNGVLKVHTKVAFKGSGLVASAAPNDQYQYTVYEDAYLNTWLDTNHIGAMPGRNLSAITTPKNPKYYFEQNKTYNGQTQLDIVMFSHFEDKEISAGDPVDPDTRLVIRKISSQVNMDSMDPNSITTEPFNQIDLTLSDVGYIAPSIN